MLLLALIAPWGAMAQTTVYDGTNQNRYFPLYAYYADDAQHTQFVMPKSDLSALNGKTITSLTFYSNGSSSWTSTGTFTMKLNNSISSTSIGTNFINTSSWTTYFTGTVTINSDGSMTIPVSGNFTYNSSYPLWIDFQLPDDGMNYSNVYFYGQDKSSATGLYINDSSISEGSTGTSVSFLPKTTFTVAPTTINNESDWNAFCAAVNGGYNYSGKTVTLNSNITVSTMAGTTSGNAFRGTFDGNGHTLTFNYTTSDSYCAPFRYANGATFKNLKVSGTINTSNQFAAGFVGQVTSNGCTFTNCVSNITISSSRNGDGTHGGFVANIQQGYNYFNGCAFTGIFTSSNGTTNCGGFAGWCETDNNARIYLTDCLFAPTNTNFSNGCNTFYRIRSTSSSYSSLTNCYYTQTFGTAQGSQGYTVTLAANPAAGGTVDGGTLTTDYGFVKAYNPGLVFNNVFYANGSISLTATANEGYVFSQWSDGNTANPRTVNVSSNTTYTANFNDASIPSISLNPTSATVLTGSTTTLTATYENVSGTPTITYTSSNTNVATVSGSGTTATVTGVAAGTATITASMTYQGTTYTATSAITVEDPSYCTPNPSSRDGKGITTLTFGSGNYKVNNSDSNGLPANSPFYGDYTSMVGSVEAGDDAIISITYSTGYTYGTIIWVDWNKNYEFEDSEIVYTGTSTSENPYLLTATFTVPATQAADDYRMRIAGADSYFDGYISGNTSANHSPCFTSTYAVCHDYTLRVVPASTDPSITLAPEDAVLRLGSTLALTATVKNVSDPTITYTSSDNTIATVSGNGTTATVTSVAEGTVTITASMTPTQQQAPL